MTTIQPAGPAALAAATAGALEGDVHQPVAARYTYGTDLDYVLESLAAVDPIDAGPRHDVGYCGADGDYGRACGPDLGLPQCAYHGRPDTIGVQVPAVSL